MLSGWAPVAIVIGIAAGVRHLDNRSIRHASRLYLGNIEVEGHTDVANRTRREATDQLRMDVRGRHGSGVVTREMEMAFEEFECKGVEGAKDQMALATIVGTAITKFERDNAGSARAASSMILSLGDRVLGDRGES